MSVVSHHYRHAAATVGLLKTICYWTAFYFSLLYRAVPRKRFKMGT